MNGLIGSCRFREAGGGHYLAPVNIGRKMEGFEVLVPPGFQIDRLPDAPGVPVALLPVQGEVAPHVVGPDHQLLGLAKSHVRGEFELDGQVAALVGTDLLPVEPDRGFPVRSADEQKYTAALPGRVYGDLAPVPADVGPVGDP